MTLDLFTAAPAKPAATAPRIVTLDAIEEALRTMHSVTVGEVTVTLRELTSTERVHSSKDGDIGVFVEWAGKTWNAGIASWGFANARDIEQAVVAVLRLPHVQPWFQRAAQTGTADPAKLPGEWTEGDGRLVYHEKVINPNFTEIAPDGVWVSVSTYDGTKPPRVHVECQATRPDWHRSQFNATRVLPDFAAARAFVLRWVPVARAFVAERVTPETCPVRKFHAGECAECWFEPEGKRGER